MEIATEPRAGRQGITVDLQTARDSDVAAALLGNTPFPSRQIELAELSLSAPPGKVTLGAVDFPNSATASWGIGVYADPSAVLRALGLDTTLQTVLDAPREATHHHVVLSWGYDVKGAASGAVGLGTVGSAEFGVDGQHSGAFGVVRCLRKDTGAADAVREVLGSWMLPRHVETPGDLPPGTWLFAEVNASVAARLGATFGYDFNWVREAKLGGLTGDIGLRLQLGVKAALSFEASGKYALVVGRESLDESDAVLRMRVFKLSARGWSFNVEAGAALQGNLDDVLEDRADDFVKAVFGVHGAQIVRDLQTIETWTDPRTDVSQVLAGFSASYVQGLITDVTGVAPADALTSGVKRLKAFVAAWDALPQRTATLLWTFVENGVDLEGLRGVVDTVATADRDAVRDLLRRSFARVDFLDRPESRLLEAMASNGILAVLESTSELAALKRSAGDVARLLDPAVSQSVLAGLQRFVERRLSLDAARVALSQADVDGLDDLLKAKLSAFLDERLDLKRLDTVRKTIALLLAKRQEYYGKAVEALNRRYELTLTAAYQRTTTRTALVDASFDFSGPASADVRAMWTAALHGDFSTLLVRQVPGVSLHEGVLSHGIERHSAVSLSLPFYARTTTRLNQALGKVSAVSDDGRVLLYEGAAKDVVTVAGRKMQLNSALTVGAACEVALNAVRTHSTEGLAYAYAFRQAVAGMRTADVRHQLRPYVDAYFPESFGGTAAPSFDVWLAAFDLEVESKTSNGLGVFGNTLIELDLSVAESVTAAWLRAPRKSDPRYRLVSLRLQDAIKRALLFSYFDTRQKYRDLRVAEPLLVYAAMPPSNGYRISTRPNRIERTPTKDVYWNWPDAAFQKDMIRRSETVSRLAACLERIRTRLLDQDGVAGLADQYDPAQATAMAARVARNEDHRLDFMRPLLVVENEIVTGACKAGVRMFEFNRAKRREPERAVEALAAFGSAVTETFNRQIGSIFGGDVLRPLGTMLFAEAAAALGADPAIRPRGALVIRVVREDSAFALPAFVAGALPPREDVVARRRIVGV